MNPTSPPRRRIQGLSPHSDRPYLQETVSIRVRFNEVDAMRVVWHGHYVNYLEEARRAFGRRYGIDYTVFFEHGITAPVAQLTVDYVTSAGMGDVLDVTARFYRTEAARLEFDYEIRRQGDGRLVATASSLQVFATPQGELLLNWPEFMLERFKAWESQWITSNPALE